ncbi:MAG TPA: GNAT family protein [Stellaceae bacterium]|nr:GNAT family protein [Stellaceae bacterium]
MTAPLTPGPRPEPVRLSGRTVRIEPLDPARDAVALFAAAHGDDPDRLFRYLFTPPFPDAGSYRDYLESWCGTANTLAFSLFEIDAELPFGSASLMRIVPEHRCIEVGSIWYAAAVQRSTATTEAMHLLARYVFDELGYRRYEWKCDSRNAPSRRAALRLGFSFEGIFRNHMIVKGDSRDTAWFAMTDEDWPSRRAAFERWLDPTNFDAAGAQRRSLADCRKP